MSASEPSTAFNLAVDLLEDHHIHSTFSDGKGTLQSNLEAGIAAGLNTLGFVDHVRIDTDWLPDYLHAARAVAKRAPMTITCGVEVKILDTTGAIDVRRRRELVDARHRRPPDAPRGRRAPSGRHPHRDRGGPPGWRARHRATPRIHDAAPCRNPGSTWPTCSPSCRSRARRIDGDRRAARRAGRAPWPPTCRSRSRSDGNVRPRRAGRVPSRRHQAPRIDRQPPQRDHRPVQLGPVDHRETEALLAG